MNGQIDAINMFAFLHIGISRFSSKEYLGTCASKSVGACKAAVKLKVDLQAQQVGVLINKSEDRRY